MSGPTPREETLYFIILQPGTWRGDLQLYFWLSTLVVGGGGGGGGGGNTIQDRGEVLLLSAQAGSDYTLYLGLESRQTAVQSPPFSQIFSRERSLL